MAASKDLLKSIYLFKTMNAEELGTIAAIAETKPFGMGDTIFLNGDTAKAMYFIQLGTIKIQRSNKNGDEVDVAKLSTGSHFGEMGFIDGQTRSASAMAADRGELVVIPYEKLQVVLAKNPPLAVKFYHELALFLCNRLRVTTTDLTFAKEANHSHF